jgi:hypothetical protein
MPKAKSAFYFFTAPFSFSIRGIQPIKRFAINKKLTVSGDFPQESAGVTARTAVLTTNHYPLF